ncbi:hypothetical protein [uncultured Methanoregula sp.]|uniref:hypothetical protein n=1 Tax=uncultured Methanoregula sp. TaxID=1005933 RepID=UPI002AAB056A|nr:hypothetical protein [uncultured Methanoregula sp.]
MSATQFFPIPPELFALACDTVSRRVSRLPFLRSGVMVNGELLGVAMECLNAEFKKTLALTTPQNALERPEDGLDRCIEERLHLPGKTTVPVIAEILIAAGIAEYAGILDRRYPHPRKGIRLLGSWTWHIASPAPSVNLPGSGEDGNSSPFSWMSLCPVCRTGILNRVVGKQLFGIPHTEFYIECSHCGAKFIPVGTQFRLVSIANIRDPLWKKNLDQSFPPETWAAIARGTSPGGNPLKRKPETKPAGQPAVAPSFALTQLMDGSFAVPFQGKTLYFRPAKITFSGSVKEDLFARSKIILSDLLENAAYEHLRSPVNAKYSRYLSMNTGLFLGQLKERHDPFYREFLNIYGDEKFGTFRLDDSRDSEKRGVLIVVVRKGLYHVADCPESIRKLVNDTFGRLLPDDCLLGHDSTRCRINAVLCNNKADAGLYTYACENGDEREKIICSINACLTA